jgi:hypothetical protein
VILALFTITGDHNFGKNNLAPLIITCYHDLAAIILVIITLVT